MMDLSKALPRIMRGIPTDRTTPAPASGSGEPLSRLYGCDEHGEFMSTGRLSTSLRGWLWSGCPTCKSEREEAEESERKRMAAESKRKAIEQALKSSQMPRRFIDRTFENFEAETTEQEAARGVCRGFAIDFDAHMKTGRSLILSGKPGTGKSHLSAAVMHSVLADGWNAHYVTCMDMIRSVRGTWRKDSERGEEEVLRSLGEKIDLLVIDEVGVQYGTDGEQNIIFDILDRRYREMRPVILITNTSRDAFRQFVGDRVFDRLREVATWVPFSWESHRPKARAV